MKFTKEDANKDLVARMTANGEKLSLSARSIDEQLETLLPLLANEEMELSDFVSKILPLFKTADSNVRNDVSTGIKDYKDNNPYKKEKTTKEKDDTKSELEKRMEALEAELNESKKEKQVNSIKTQLRQTLKEKGVKDDEWINTLIAEVSINEDFNVDEKVDKYVTLFNKSKAQVRKDTTPDGAGGGAGDDKYLNDTISAAAEFAKSLRL